MGTQAGLQITCFVCIILSMSFLMKNKEWKRKIKDFKSSFVLKAKMPYSLQTTGKASMHRLQTHTAPWPAALDGGSTRSVSLTMPPHILSFPTDTEPSKVWGSLLLPACLESLLHSGNSSRSQGKGSTQIMRNGYFLLNWIRQKFVIWFPDITEDKGRSEVET